MSPIEGAVQYTGEPGAMLYPETDPWLQRPDGTVVELGQVLALMAPGPCGECRGGYFAPTGNGPTEEGIERCDGCDVHEGDFAAALALAATIGPDVTVWYLPEGDEEEDEWAR